MRLGHGGGRRDGGVGGGGPSTVSHMTRLTGRTGAQSQRETLLFSLIAKNLVSALLAAFRSRISTPHPGSRISVSAEMFGG